jgi:CheY-like chemotaxis protein
MLSTAADVRALVITPDAVLASVFLEISRELGIETDTWDLLEGIPGAIGREKYEALLIDFDSVQNAAAALAALRANPSNRGAVVFAVATAHDGQQLALSHGANFVLRRPLDNKELRRTLYAAYEAMTEERRRYFRCTAELPVFLTRADGSDLAARTGNISANGMSIISSTNFTAGEHVGIALEFEAGEPHVLARGVVVWDDRHGKTGISFHCVRPELQKVLDSWLDAQFKKMREDSVCELQKTRSAIQSGD